MVRMENAKVWYGNSISKYGVKLMKNNWGRIIGCIGILVGIPMILFPETRLIGIFTAISSFISFGVKPQGEEVRPV